MHVTNIHKIYNIKKWRKFNIADLNTIIIVIFIIIIIGTTILRKSWPDLKTLFNHLVVVLFFHLPTLKFLIFFFKPFIHSFIHSLFFNLARIKSTNNENITIRIIIE
jgi:Mn2+/Fe2+ NRAMP family transporter